MTQSSGFFEIIGNGLNTGLVLGKSAVNTFSQATQAMPVTMAFWSAMFLSFVTWACLNRKDPDGRNFLMRKFDGSRDSLTVRQSSNVANISIALAVGWVAHGFLLNQFGAQGPERDRYHRQIQSAQSARPAQPTYERPASLSSGGNGNGKKRHEVDIAKEEIIEEASAPANPGTGRCVFTLDPSKKPCPKHPS